MRLPAAEQFLKFQQAADDSDRHLALATSAPCTVIFPELWWFDNQDGIPIRGPYGNDGRLINASQLDECNGRSVTNENGEQVPRRVL